MRSGNTAQAPFSDARTRARGRMRCGSSSPTPQGLQTPRLPSPGPVLKCAASCEAHPRPSWHVFGVRTRARLAGLPGACHGVVGAKVEAAPACPHCSGRRQNHADVSRRRRALELRLTAADSHDTYRLVLRDWHLPARSGLEASRPSAMIVCRTSRKWCRHSAAKASGRRLNRSGRWLFA